MVLLLLLLLLMAPASLLTLRWQVRTGRCRGKAGITPGGRCRRFDVKVLGVDRVGRLFYRLRLRSRCRYLVQLGRHRRYGRCRRWWQRW
uniref:Putative secreted protein n=1 Tax=Anopheles marajoara TaxID=58244 RepID=A0A2M4CA37_9DIPT